MPTIRLKTRQDIEDFVRGTDFLSSTGGGSTEEAQSRLLEDIEAGLEVGWQDVETLDDSGLVVCASFAGSIAPQTFDRTEMERRFGVEPSVLRPLVTAVQELETYMGVYFDAVIPLEIGGINTGLALDAAVSLQKPLLDADYAGRAIPEATCNTAHIAGKELTPRMCVDYYGNKILIKRTANNAMTERLTKHLAVASFGIVGCAWIPLTGKEVKEIAVPGTLTRSLSIGRSIRHAKDAGGDPVEKVVAAISDTWLLFRGKIVGRSWENRDGYMWGEHEIAGEGEFQGHRLRLWFKNENQMSWLDGRPYVSSPDILEVVDDDTTEPLLNTSIRVGQRVGVIGIKRCKQLDSSPAIDALGPKHWGFDVEYTPIEQLLETDR